MSDLSSLSDDQLKALYAQHTAAPAAATPSAAPDLSKLSDDDLKALHAALPAKESLGSDLAKSAGAGLANATAGTLGALGDARDLISGATDYAGRKLGIDPDKVQSFKNAVSAAAPVIPGIGLLATAPSSREIINSAPDAIVSPDYKPQTVAGGYAKTGAEFLPGAFLGGGEGLLSRLATRVAAPAIGSETLGLLTKDTAAEPYARMAGALAGGVGGSSLANVLSRAPEVGAPTIEELKDAARAQYNSPDVKAVRINPDATDFLHHWIQNDLENGTNAGFRAANEPKTFAAIAELSNPNASMGRSVGAPATIDDIQSVRKVLGRIADQKDATGNLTSDAVAANRAIGHINTFLENIQQPDLVAGNADRARTILQDAGQNWGAAKRAEEIATRAENARIQAASTYGGGNINNAMRQALRPLVKNDFQKARGFNDQERQALEDAVTGSRAGNLARQIGKLGPDTGLKGLEHIVAAFKTGGASIPLSLASLGAKIGGDASTRRAINNLGTMLRERSPLHRENVAAVTQPMLPSRAVPGVMVNNPNYVPPPVRRPVLPNGLGSALLAARGAGLPQRLYIAPPRRDDASGGPAGQ